MDNMVLNRLLCRIGRCLFTAALVMGAWYAHVYYALPAFATKSLAAVPAMKWPERTLRDISLDGSIFKKQQNARVPGLGPLAKRFRLAGTFLAVSASQQSRKAIIDVLKDSTQHLVSEGEMLDQTVHVKSVLQDCVVLREGQEEEELWLSFSEAGRIREGAGSEARKEAGDGTGADTATLNRFGRRVGDRRWVLKRSAVLEYYQELLNDTERLAKVFESMKPVYRGSSIEGYVLDVEGEHDVFDAFGLHQGDVIRKVNSMPMTSRVRAEYFIREFVKDRANAFVLDIEREGRAERLVYMVR